MKDEVVAPKRVINIKDIKELKGIALGPKTGLRIGALVTIQELLDNPAIHRQYPALAQAAEGVTSPQIRAMGTVGGDLCQRPRCWYYRSGYGLMARGPDGEPMVPRGDNRYHAIFGGGPAYFVSPSSLAPALAALGAWVSIEGPSGKPRSVMVSDFFVAPKNGDQRENVLNSNEVVTWVSIPLPATKSATYEVRQKEALD